MSNKNEIIESHLHDDAVHDIESVYAFGEIREAWDELDSRINQLLASSDHEVMFREPPHTFISYQHRMVALYAFFSLFFMAMALFWGSLIHSLAFNNFSLFVALFIELLYILFFVDSIRRTVELFSHDPSRAVILIESGLNDRCFRPTKVAVTCLAALLAFAVLSSTTTGIDGYTMSQNYDNRSTAIESVTNTLVALCKTQIS